MTGESSLLGFTASGVPPARVRQHCDSGRSVVHGPRFVWSRVQSLRDEVFAEVVFGSEGIVGAAAESEVF
jgi:hypothetical protein